MKNEDINGINVKKGMAIVANNKMVYARLLKSFVNNSFGDRLIEAIESGDSEQIRQNAHALKGVAGNMHMEELYELSRSIEADAKEGRSVPPDKVEEFKRQSGETLVSVKMLIDNPDVLDHIE